MALSYKTRRRLSLVVLLIVMPVYVVICVTILNRIGPLPVLLQLIVYIVLGVAWIFPFKFVFMGVGKEDPDAKK